MMELYSNLSERQIHHGVGQLPSPKMGTLVVFPGRVISQVIDNKRMGDLGFEPLTSTVCRKLGQI